MPSVRPHSLSSGNLPFGGTGGKLLVEMGSFGSRMHLEDHSQNMNVLELRNYSRKVHGPNEDLKDESRESVSRSEPEESKDYEFFEY